MGEWNKENAIYFSNIKQGFHSYDNEIVWMGEKEAFDFFRRKWKEAKEESVYADFYYSRLEERSKEIVDQVLSEEEQQYVRGLADQIIYPLDEKLLKIITRLNARKILFSTIYFTGEARERSTWWGNYNQEYIVFREKI